MQLRRFTSYLFSAAVCLAAAFSSHASSFVDTCVATARAVKNLMLDGLQLFSPAVAAERKPQVWRIKAKAFKTRLIKRERPEMSGSWRMCPST